MDYEIVQKAYSHVLKLFKSKLSPVYLFHSQRHTEKVMKTAEEIGKYENLTEEEVNLVKLCALFHDTGYVKSYKDHETESVRIARKFLQENMIEESTIELICKTILSTKIPQKPKTIYAKILCDADLINLSSDNYFETAEDMRMEWMNTGQANMSEVEFHQNSIQFFKNHTYHTGYGKKILVPKKQKILERIENRVEELQLESKN